jgi:hypothetical protein
VEYIFFEGLSRWFIILIESRQTCTKNGLLFSRSLQLISLTMKTELVLETLVYSPLNHLTRLLDWESFIEQNLGPQWFKILWPSENGPQSEDPNTPECYAVRKLCLVTSFSSLMLFNAASQPCGEEQNAETVAGIKFFSNVGRKCVTQLQVLWILICRFYILFCMPSLPVRANWSDNCVCLFVCFPGVTTHCGSIFTVR